jgi:hypothetical protein
MIYNLNHLTQPASQAVAGPIQDDEALVLYSVIRASRLKRIVEIGGLSGYSANNFLEAINGNGIVYTIDYNQVTQINSNHKVIVKSAEKVTKEDIGDRVDMVFFDCHDYESSLSFFTNMVNCGVIDDDTILAAHDTNLHHKQFMSPDFYNGVSAFYNGEGWIHQVAERKLVNIFSDLGYQIFNLNTKPEDHDESFPVRHGLTLCKKFKKFNNEAKKSS